MAKEKFSSIGLEPYYVDKCGYSIFPDKKDYDLEKILHEIHTWFNS